MTAYPGTPYHQLIRTNQQIVDAWGAGWTEMEVWERCFDEELMMRVGPIYRRLNHAFGALQLADRVWSKAHGWPQSNA